MQNITIPCPKCLGKGNDFASATPKPEDILVCKHCGHEIGSHADIMETIIEGARRLARKKFEEIRRKK